jgi:hypothetical protein
MLNSEDRETDGDLPPLNSTLSDWRWFVFRNIGPDSEAHQYLEELCEKFGADYLVEQEPLVFLNHVGWVAYENNRKETK